ncbi:MAG: LLM class F420-dependent oxidoreductase [bacterium]|nr:LLM class F420-dependent oxidoreductase [Gammaproteobacteria bacterium]HIL95466.1 LLM class F420-dependent oxidoreductase [Pseudomonadales bacterium]
MKIGLFATFMSPTCGSEMVAEFGSNAEEIGIESLWLGEHVVLFDKMEFPYPGSKDGKIPVPAGGGMLDTVATIGFMASRTTKLRFGTGITLVPQRNPVYTANEFATLDWLSNGRIDFGVGVGWCKEEVLACGYSWEDRGKRCDEFLEVIKRLWTDEVASFEGDHFSLPECRLDPKPIQNPHIPMIIGGHSEAGFRRAARFGAGWYGFNLSPELTQNVLGNIDRALEKQNRTRDDFDIVITPPYNATPATVREYEDLGVDRLVMHLGNQKPERVEQRLTEMEKFVAA